jgi:hypothetical protein
MSPRPWIVAAIALVAAVGGARATPNPPGPPPELTRPNANQGEVEAIAATLTAPAAADLEARLAPTVRVHKRVECRGLPAVARSPARCWPRARAKATAGVAILRSACQRHLARIWRWAGRRRDRRCGPWAAGWIVGLDGAALARALSQRRGCRRDCWRPAAPARGRGARRDDDPSYPTTRVVPNAVADGHRGGVGADHRQSYQVVGLSTRTRPRRRRLAARAADREHLRFAVPAARRRRTRRP